MKTGHVGRSASLFLQRAEGALHVLQQLSVLGLDLSLAIFHWVLCTRRSTPAESEQTEREPHFPLLLERRTGLFEIGRAD